MNCPICGTTQLTFVTDQIRDGEGKVYWCESCDLQMLDSPPMEYGHEYRQTHGPVLGKAATPEEIYEAYKDHQSNRVNILWPFLHSKASLLEIGCSAGQFLSAISEHVVRAVGSEPNSAAATHGRSLGFEVWTVKWPQDCFDIVCAFQVLEHVPCLSEFLAKIRDYMKPNGVVVIEVPSTTDPLLTFFDCPAYRRFFYHRAHNWYFSPQSLRMVMSKAGFEPAQYQDPAYLDYDQIMLRSGDNGIHYLHAYNFANAMHWLHKGEPQPSCAVGLGRSSWSSFERSTDLGHMIDITYKRCLVGQKRTENIMYIGRIKQ